jgi:hypothetical protein
MAMRDQELKRQLDKIAREAFPDTLHPWPTFQARLQTRSSKLSRRGFTMKTQIHSIKTFPRAARVAAIIVLTLLCMSGFLMFTPQGHAWAQDIMQFFTRVESDALPVQSWQLTPLPTPGVPTPDPASILDVHQTVGEVEQLVGYQVLQPSWLPDVLSLVGASYQPDHHLVRIFYRDVETNGLVLKQEPFQGTGDCDLCDKIGASAPVETVQIGGASGEYVEGVWKLTDKGPVWESDPYQKTLRWQANHTAFELAYMGTPDSVTKADLIAIAQSIK